MGKNYSALVVKDLRKRFDLGKALKGLSLNANEGDVISKLGAPGSGKSTFLHCVNLLEIPDSGSVTVRGETIHMVADRAGNLAPADVKQVVRLRAQLGIVFQKVNLWSHMTVLDNVAEALICVLELSKIEAFERAQATLDKIGLSNRLNYYPAHLSGGQQRAAIALDPC